MRRRYLFLPLLLLLILPIVYFWLLGQNREELAFGLSDQVVINTQVQWAAGTLDFIDFTTTPDSIQMDLNEHAVNFESADYPDANTFIGDLGAVYQIIFARGYDTNVGWTSFSSADGINWDVFEVVGAGTGCTDGGDGYGTLNTLARYIKVVKGSSDGWCPGSNPIDNVTASNTISVHTSADSQIDAGVHNSVDWTTFAPNGSEPANTSIDFRFRTSADSSSWSAWSASEPYAASIDISGLAGDRYLQVETTLSNTNGIDTPILASYVVNFDYDDTPAPTCNDGIQNGDETGVDCGGSCDACPVEPTCNDGIQNGDETGVDCGGSCDACPVPESCSDGILNQNETGIDCGGVCDACPVEPTCTDYLKNGDETGVDCGGSCDACPIDEPTPPSAPPSPEPILPTCTDGTMNGDETGIDCGGSCLACEIPVGEFHVELNPEFASILPNSRLKYIATAYDDSEDVSNKSEFTFSLSNGGEIVEQDKNDLTIESGDDLGTFNDVVKVVAKYHSQSASDTSSFEVKLAGSSDDCAGVLCNVLEENPVNSRGLGSNSTAGSIAFIVAAIIAAANLIYQAIGFGKDLISPFIKGRDKKSIKSTIYDSATGLPLRGIKILLINVHDGLRTLEASAVSNGEGKYTLEISPGRIYEIKVEAKGYDQFLDNRNELEKSALPYLYNYFGGDFNASDNQYIFDKNIPMVESDISSKVLEIIKKAKLGRVLTALNISLLLLGSGLAVLIAISYPITINFLIVGLYGLTYLLILVRVAALRGRSYGMVYNLSGNNPVDLGIVRAIRTNDGKLEKTTVSDEHGKYALAIPRGKYDIFVTKQGFKQQHELQVNVKNSFKPQTHKIAMEKKEAFRPPLILDQGEAEVGTNTHPNDAGDIIGNYHGPLGQ